MGFVDKLKNIFFEEEEEDEEAIEDTRPLKKLKEKEKVKERGEIEVSKEPQEEVIAKKVEIPRRKKEEITEEPPRAVEEINYNQQPRRFRETPEQYEEIPREEPPKKEQSKISNIIFDDEDFLLSDIKPKEEPKREEKTSKVRDSYKEREIREKEPPTYEYKRKEETKPRGFTPSPIISPIYGILDKNYRKEEVKEKKEIRLTSRVDRLDLDSVRNKAFGDLENDLFPGSIDDDIKTEIPRQEINKIKEDMEDDGKPVVDKVTLGEADEYYSDLGLAYNTDYKDISKEINDGKVKSKKEKEGRLEDNLFDLIDDEYDRED